MPSLQSSVRSACMDVCRSSVLKNKIKGKHVLVDGFSLDGCEARSHACTGTGVARCIPRADVLGKTRVPKRSVARVPPSWGSVRMPSVKRVAIGRDGRTDGVL